MNETTRRRHLLLAGMALLAGCASLAGPRTVEVSHAKLLQAIAGQFPLRMGLNERIELLAASPRLRSLPQENRLATEVDLEIGPGLGRALGGTIGFSYGLRYEPGDRTVRMTGLRIDRLDLGRSGDLLRLQGTGLATRLAEELLDGLVVYRLRPEDVRRLDVSGYEPGEVRATPQGLAITFLPRR